MDLVPKIKAFIVNQREYLKDIDDDAIKNDNYDYFFKITDSLDIATGMTKGDAEKEALILDAAVRYANQLAFILFRYDKLTEEAIREFRSFPTPEATDKAAREAQEPRKARLAEIQEQEAAYRKDERDRDIFVAVLAKQCTKEEAEAELARYEEQLKAQAMQQGQMRR